MNELNEKAPSRLRLFLRAAVGDFTLVLVASVGLVLTVSFGFESAPIGAIRVGGGKAAASSRNRQSKKEK